MPSVHGDRIADVTTDQRARRPMEFVPHSPAEGVYAATDDYVHAMEVRGAGFQPTAG
jgi:hypothetical protein